MSELQDASPDGRPTTRVRRARWAVSAVFLVHGAVSGTFATRIPWVREHLALGPGQLGLALACVTVGASVLMPVTAYLAHRWGPRGSLRALSVLCCAALVLPPLMPGLGALCLGLFVYGCGLGLLDVAMNAHGVRLEKRYGRSVMSGLHGMWSVGALVGGSGGALAAHVGLDARVHLGLAAPVLVTVALLACCWALDEQPAAEGVAGPGSGVSGAAGRTGAAEEPEGPPRFALPSRDVLAIGAVGFCAVFAEGASMDWSGIYLSDVTGAEPGLAAAAYTAFACTMAGARLAGDRLVGRFGAVRTVRVGGVLAAAGGALVVAAEVPAIAVAGFALIGVGIAVVVPLCFAAAGRTATGESGQAITGVATLAYAAGLAAPSAVGWIAEATSLPVSFVLVTLLTAGLVLGAGVLRTPVRSGTGDSDTGTGTDAGTGRKAATDAGTGMGGADVSGAPSAGTSPGGAVPS